jgi:hypothetical protein
MLLCSGAAQPFLPAADLSPPVEMTAQEDHALMMEKLGITSIRRGANGRDSSAPNAANYDESKANPYPHLPDPLLTQDRQAVTSTEMWWDVRRPEIVELFDREVYGRVPIDTLGGKWEVVETVSTNRGDIKIKTTKLTGHVENGSFPMVEVDILMDLTVPAAAKSPVPVILQFGFVFRGDGPPGRFGPRLGSGPSWQDLLLEQGWGYASISANSIQPDNGAGLTKGIIGLVNKGQPREPDDWGALRAWAWGASCALDYFETDDSVDAKRVGITGDSRYGKAALVTQAYDSRFAIGYISSSGAGGAKRHRRNAGEIVENVAGSGEYHWMAGNYIKYAGPLTWDDLPVDSHELVALCAPRPVFISSGESGDGWVDARGMFLAGLGAVPVYELLGRKGMGTDEFPAVETGLMDGGVAFRQHSGGHTPGPNWPTFIEFAARYF